MEKIKGGATIWARQTLESDIYLEKPAEWFKIWFFIVNKVNHKDTKFFKRGNNFFTYKEIQDKTKTTKNQVKHCLEWLKKSSMSPMSAPISSPISLYAPMIATQKKSRGMIISVIKYDFFQTLDNYILFQKATQKGTRKEHRRNTEATLCNKNVKNVKNVKNRERGDKSPAPAEINRIFFAKGSVYTEIKNLLLAKKPKWLVDRELDKFISYWTEPNKSGTKVRWEQQPTFEIKRRLQTWFNKVK